MIIGVVWSALALCAVVITLMATRTRHLRPSRWIGIVGVALILLMVWLGWWDTHRLQWYLSTARWPVVKGQVIASQIVGERAFAPEVKYSYQVGDSTYVATTDLEVPRFGNKNVRLDVAEKSIAAYPVGTTVTVHYNPQSPREARLKASAPWNVYAKLSTAIFGSLGGIVLLTIYLRSSRRSRD